MDANVVIIVIVTALVVVWVVERLQLSKLLRICFYQNASPVGALSAAAAVDVAVAVNSVTIDEASPLRSAQQAKGVAQMPSVPGAHIHARPVALKREQIEDSTKDAVLAVLTRDVGGVGEEAVAIACALDVGSLTDGGLE